MALIGVSVERFMRREEERRGRKRAMYQQYRRFQLWEVYLSGRVKYNGPDAYWLSSPVRTFADPRFCMRLLVGARGVHNMGVRIAQQ